MIITPIKTRIFKESDNLFAFTCSYFAKIDENSIIVVTSKIVALSERRTAVVKNSKEKDLLIQQESELAYKTKHVWLTIKDGMVLPSAGIDESNANGKLILLPKDSFKTAEILRMSLCKKYSVRHLGVIITDSRTFPLRAGVTGVALGYSGFCGIKDYRGLRDIYGRKFKYSRVNVADGLAAAASLTMGEGSEQRPLVLIKEAPVIFRDRINRKEVSIDAKEDMYRSFLFPRLN